MNKSGMVLRMAISLMVSFYSSYYVRTYCNLAENYGAKVWDSIYDIDETKLAAEIPSANIKLYFVKNDKDFGMYEGFILQINDVKKYFRWENVNGNRSPELILSDLDKDGREELIIILNKGYGTGVQDEEVHVIKQELFFYEILVEEPLIPLHKKVKIEKSNEQVIIILNNKKTVLNKRGMTALPYQELGAGYGHHVAFEVNNDILYSRVLLGVGMNAGIGEFIIKYKFKDEIFQVEGVEFIPCEEYLNK